MDLFCPWEPANYLIFSSNTAHLLFYSHIPSLVIALIIGLLVFFKSKKSPSGKTLLVITVLFALWCFFDLILWATNQPSLVMFFWSMQVLLEPLIFVLAFYLTNSFIKKEVKISNWTLVLFLLYLPVVIFLPSSFNLQGVNLEDCTAVEGLIAQYYTYFVEVISIISIFILTEIESKKAVTVEKLKETRTFGIGVVLFLIAFSWGNIIGSFSDNWQLAQIGLIGMPIFVGFLAYLMVKYKTFNIKAFGTQVLTITLWGTLASMLFVRTIENVRIILGLTLILFFIVGILLIRSVKREIRQREQLEILSKELEDANQKLKALDLARAEFISIASHQLRTPPATIKWYMSSILSGDYGKIPKEAFTQLEKVQTTNNGLISLIEDILNVSRIERGKMEFMFQEIELSEIANQAFEQLIPIAKEKGLKYTFKKPKKTLPKIMADREKLKQVMNNIIDNSIKYTPKGSVEVSLAANSENIVFEVKDTGKGFSKEEESQIFQKFSRGKESLKHSAGLGLGLYVAKIIIEQHKGKLFAQSPGEGKGSKFSFTIPIHSGIKTTTLVDLGK